MFFALWLLIGALLMCACVLLLFVMLAVAALPIAAAVWVAGHVARAIARSAP